jgi:hypothetical protein
MLEGVFSLWIERLLVQELSVREGMESDGQIFIAETCDPP